VNTLDFLRPLPLERDSLGRIRRKSRYQTDAWSSKPASFLDKTVEVALAKVESVGVTVSFVGRMFGYGDVIVRGTGGTTESFAKIASPEELSRQVQGQLGSMGEVHRDKS